MNDIQIMDQIVNSYAMGGENIPDGLRQGPSVSAGVLPGIPTGMVHPSYLQSYVPATISEFTTTGSVAAGTTIQFYLAPAAANPISKVTQIQNSVSTLQLYQPLSLKWESGNAISGTWYISGFDRYYRQMAFQRTYTSSSGANFYHGIYLVTNAYFVPSATISSGTAITLSTSDWIELPYTDYGFAGNLLSAVGGKGTDANAYPLYIAIIPAENLYYQNGFGYKPASWKTNVTVSAGRPRPLIDLSGFRATTQAANVVVNQLLYAFNNTLSSLENFAGSPITTNTWDSTTQTYAEDAQPQFNPSEETVYGRANNITGWKGWVG